MLRVWEGRVGFRGARRIREGPSLKYEKCLMLYDGVIVSAEGLSHVR